MNNPKFYIQSLKLSFEYVTELNLTQQQSVGKLYFSVQTTVRILVVVCMQIAISLSSKLRIVFTIVNDYTFMKSKKENHWETCERPTYIGLDYGLNPLLRGDQHWNVYNRLNIINLVLKKPISFKSVHNLKTVYICQKQS